MKIQSKLLNIQPLAMKPVYSHVNSVYSAAHVTPD